MKQKKVMALLLAATMILGTSMQAFAATGTENNTSAGQTITGEGDVTAVETTVYSVTIPTTATTKLVIDPQGIMDMKDGDTATKEDLAENAGKITCASKAVITNLSSVPAKVTVDLTLTGDATPVTDLTSVDADTANNILLYANPSATDVPVGADVANTYTASNTGIIIPKTTPASVEFVLDEADYVFKKASSTTTYELATANTGHGTALEFAGYVNKNADWSDYLATATTKKSIGMTAKFTFTHTLASGDVADTTEGAPYAMKAYSGDTVDLTPPAPEDVAPSIEDALHTQGDDTALDIPYSLGSGESGANAITDVVVTFNGALYSKNGAFDSSTDMSTHITIANDKITLSGEWLSYFPAGTYPICIVYDNNTEKTSMIDLVVE